MSYIGKEPQYTDFLSKFFNGDGTAMTVTLDAVPPNEAALLVFIDGVRQDTSAYTVSGYSLTFTGIVPSGTNNVQVVHLGIAQDTQVPVDDSVSTVKIQDDAVTSAKLANALNITSGNSLTIDSGATITNNGTASGFCGDVYFYGELASNQTTTRSVWTKLTGLTSNELDSHSAFDGTTFTVPSGKGGKYFIYALGWAFYDNAGNDGEQSQLGIYVNGTNKIQTNILGYSSTGLHRRETINVSTIQNLSAGDTVEVYGFTQDLNGSGSAEFYAGETNFFGWRISP